MFKSKRLSSEQLRMIEAAERRPEPVGLSAISLVEIANLAAEGRLDAPLEQFFADLETEPLFQILPITPEIASEYAAVRPALRDPADAVIVATARVHGLRLVTSDQRIIHSGLVAVIE